MTVEEVIWHDVECGAYAEDLELWEGLASRHGSPVLELGSGTGRVALHLARRGFEVHALERDDALAKALEARADREHVPVRVAHEDVRELRAPAEAYPLVIGAMQLIQLLDGRAGRSALLEGVARALEPGGTLALAIVEGAGVLGEAGPETVPDVRERDGWVHSSLPLGVSSQNGHLEVRRLRQTVSPEGRLTEARHVDILDVLDSATVEREAAAAGLSPRGHRAIGQSEMHVGSTVVLLGRDA